MIPESHSLAAFVFDMDGVLIDSHPVHFAAWKEFLWTVGVNKPDSELYFILEGRTRTDLLRHFLGDLPEPELAELGRRKDHIFRRMEGDIRPFPGILEFLGTIERRGIPCGIATSASEIRTASTIERLGLGGFFDAVITAADVRLGKPHPQVYQLACRKMNVDPAQTVAFDDAPAGIASARAAGLQCIGISHNGTASALLEAGARNVISTFQDPCLELLLSSISRAGDAQLPGTFSSKATTWDNES